MPAVLTTALDTLISCHVDLVFMYCRDQLAGIQSLFVRIKSSAQRMMISTLSRGTVQSTYKAASGNREKKKGPKSQKKLCYLAVDPWSAGDSSG